MAVSITVKHQLTLCKRSFGFVADTARESSSEGKHRSVFDSGVFSNSVGKRFQSTTCSAEEHTQLQDGSPGRSEKNEKSIA